MANTKVKVTVTQKNRKVKVGRNSTISQKGHLKFKVSTPVKVTVTLVQKGKNPNLQQKQGGSIKLASANKKTKEA